MMPGRFENKVAVVPGGNSGIGEATARPFAQEGAMVAILARREPEGLAVQQSIQEAGGDALFVPCDVSNRTPIESAVDKIIGHFAVRPKAKVYLPLPAYRVSGARATAVKSPSPI